MTAPLVGAGLFDVRSLSTDTLVTFYEALLVGPEAETRLSAMVRRILLERGAI